jgi:hypothetical protein
MPKTNKGKSKKINKKKITTGKSRKMQIQEEPIVSGNMPIVFSWVTVDFKSKSFNDFSYILAAIGAMAMIGWGVYDRNFVMVATFMAMVIVIILTLNDEPRKVNVIISENGIDLNEVHYSYNEFRSFKIANDGDVSMLTLKHRKSLSMVKTIYLEDEPINDLESFLGIYMEKEEDTKEA